MLQGITFGRTPARGPRDERLDLVHREALRLASRPVDGELTALWRQFERAAFRIVGEEYPNFVGDPRRAAPDLVGRSTRAGRRGPRAARSPAAYIAGMSPGYRLGVGLGGNVAGLSRAEVNRWRNAYIAERARLGVAGFGEFRWWPRTRGRSCFQDVSRAVARGMALLA